MMTTQKKPLATTYALIILLIVAAGLLYGFLFLKPGLAKIEAMREANLDEEQAIATLENRLAQKKETESRWEAARQNEDFLRTKVPAVSALPEVLGALEKLVFSADLKIGTLNAYEFRDDEGYRVIPVSISAGGKMEALLVLLEGIEQLSAFLGFELKIEPKLIQPFSFIESDRRFIKKDLEREGHLLNVAAGLALRGWQR